MTQEVTASVTIDLPRDQCWQKLRDISAAHNYVPGIVKTQIVSDNTEGLGASRYVYRNARSYIQETVTEWTEGSGFLIRLHRRDKPAPPFRDAHFRYRLEDGEQAGTTLFTASMDFQLPWGGFGAWLEKRLAGFVQKTIADVAVSMKLYYETGEPTTPAALKACKSGSN
jgi:hypothetical protein